MYFVAHKNNLSKFCSFIFRKAQSRKNVAIIVIITILITIFRGVARIDKLAIANIKYKTCLKLK